MGSDCTVVGASFAGLASAYALAQRGVSVTVLEKKRDTGDKLHTTGIIVKDAVDQIALLDALPSALVRRIAGVRLYAPNLRSVDLAAPGYYFLATDTPGVLRWLAAQAESAGARVAYASVFKDARRSQSGFDLGELGTTRFLIGADGPHSRVARALSLGLSRRFLAGVGGVQAGLARRQGGDTFKPDAAMAAFLSKIKPVIDLTRLRPASVRAGLIPCGGVVSPVAASRALLVGDAAGMVSPVTAGGIHTALKHGLAAGNAVADFLEGRAEDPAGWFVRSYPKFRIKRLLRYAFDRFQSDLAFNLLLATRPMRAAAGIIYFHHKGVFDAAAASTAVGEARGQGL